jgi:histone acetyltransferase (RNA polymerase elongator complex component)
MTAIIREKKWLKETISVEEGKEKLRQHNNYGWTLVE